MSLRLLLKPGEPGDAVLWSLDARGRPQPTDADEAGLSDELSERIEEWVDALDAAFDEDTPEVRRFASETERRAFHAEGQAIAAAIRDEIGDEATLELDFTALEGGLA
ncbi:MAG: hypothetical protein ACRCUE_12975 [Bosea sp. (in: a-proteobacteria)]